MNKIDDGAVSREIVVAKFTSLTPTSFCALSRYRHLRTADFTDDITTINANELLMGAAGGPEQFQQEAPDQAMANQQIQQMINQLHQPQMPAGLIQERGFQGNEADMIAMQEALLAQMEQDNEDIYIEDDEEEEGTGQANAQGGGLMNYLSGLLFGNRPPGEEEKKQE